MESFTSCSGVAAAILLDNIDTDAIIPSREMKLVSKTGLSAGLFATWRYTLPGSRHKNSEFILNQPDYANTSILLVGANFGCGSSREHAVWALKEFGVRAIIAPSFGSIFYGNCIRNAVLPVTLSIDLIKRLARATHSNPQNHLITVDLVLQSVKVDDIVCFDFEFSSTHREMLLNGLDDISMTERWNRDIEEFEKYDRELRPWIYL
jgi:3-isopropylmalate/(R)-2-methylmalate dehydratase small subunit